MNERISIAQARIDRAPAILKVYGLGSCLAVALYDPQNRVGSLAHLLLPNCPTQKSPGDQGKYVDVGIRLMLDGLLRFGADRQNLVAKIAGGANMFESEYKTLIHSIGARNARSARETLAKLGIPLAGEEVGGNRGRTVELDLASGQMLVYCARDGEKILL